jgi:hypothetical protein
VSDDRAQRLSLGISRVGGESESDRRLVRLFARAQKLREACGFPEHEQQQAGRQRIERPRVTDSPFAEGTTHARDDIVRRRTRRLVNG